jgi:hypothetical protein
MLIWSLPWVITFQNWPIYSIVAVHGIGGNSFSTWTDGSSLWLRDFLPDSEHFKNTRVMTFGYESSIFTSPFAPTPLGRNFTFGEALANDLLMKRKTKAVSGSKCIWENRYWRLSTGLGKRTSHNFHWTFDGRLNHKEGKSDILWEAKRTNFPRLWHTRTSFKQNLATF